VPIKGTRGGKAADGQPSLFGAIVTDDDSDGTWVELGAETEAPKAPVRAGPRMYAVSELTGRLRLVLGEDPVLSDVWVTGEVTNLSLAASGHLYFSLKDERASMAMAIWAGVRKRINVPIANGDKIEAHGALSVYEPRGSISLVVDAVRKAGQGDLFAAFNRLKEKLAAEGLFDPERKRELPFLPRGVGVVTSSKGAVIQDIYRVIRRRFPNMPIHLAPVKVQGEGAAAEIVAGIDLLARDPDIDLIIVARGGGSLEDLWAFNEEPVARAIAACSKPVISGVGHETDTTIADFVADRRAATPSVAAELAVPVKDDLVADIEQTVRGLAMKMRQLIQSGRQQLAALQACRFLARPQLLVSERKLTLANRERELETLLQRRLETATRKHSVLAARLLNLDPRRLLARGYLMAVGPDDKVITSVRQLRVGADVRLHLGDGRAVATVTSAEPLAAVGAHVGPYDDHDVQGVEVGAKPAKKPVRPRTRKKSEP
jgi:exodeoxyribonuclease VII large subunit